MRAHSGTPERAFSPVLIRPSVSEWKKVRRLNDKFWLYIVTDAARDMPQLHQIQNPVMRFQMDEDVFATGFTLSDERWRRLGRLVVSRVTGV